MRVTRRRAGVAGAVLLAVVLAVTGCSKGATKVQKQEHSQQAATSQQLLNNQPLPAFNYSQVRQNLIDIETARAKGVQTTSFFFNQGVGDPVFSCASVGAPLPTTSQLSNPSQVERHSGDGGGNAVIGQMDPDGVYTGDSSGTYVMCVGGDGQEYAQYWEGFVLTVFAPAEWDASKHQVRIVGRASYDFKEARR